jgi:hypothetical protein
MSLQKPPSFLTDFFETEMNGGEKRIWRFKSLRLKLVARQWRQDDDWYAYAKNLWCACSEGWER